MTAPSPAPEPVRSDETAPVLPVAEPVADVAPAASAGDGVVERVMAMVSEATGYPADMLDPELDLEADLGIDTVKQAEVFGSIREAFGIERDDKLQLRDYPTLNHVVGFVRERAEGLGATPSVAAESVADVAPAASAGDGVVERVMAMVSEATGYPADMLDPELDLEADLGIDTVKQAEVFGSIREAFGIERDDKLQLRDYPTLNHVVGFVRERAEGLGATPSVAAESVAEAALPTHVAPKAPEGSIEAANRVRRRVPVPELRPELARCLPTAVELGERSRVVVAADQGGVVAALVERLRERGVDVLTIEGAPDGEELASTIADWRGEEHVDGVYWLPALDVEEPLSEVDLEAWRASARVRVHVLHRTIRELYDDIDESEQFLVAATRLGGLHGYGPDGATAPMGGAVTGFVKAYNREKPEALVKAVDVAVGADPSVVADWLLDETDRDPGCVEVGYHDGERWTVGLREEPASDGQPGMELGPDSVFVVTGAAGSIVSAIVADLAKHSGGTFHLLDLTPEPDPKDEDVRRLSIDRDGLKRDIFDRLKESGERATPALVDRELARLERLEAALAAIEAIDDAGGTAYYHAVDLTDPEAVAAVMGAIRDRHSRVDVLVHAAGIDVSRFLADKEPEEFALVFGVKAEGWVNLLAAAGDLPIGATVVFSSVAGRFGNGGQTDYSAANDLLCKYTSNFRTTRPDTRAIALDFTAWADIGMATRGSIPQMMAMAGIEMLPAEAGIATVRRELTSGGTRGEVLIADSLGILGEEVHPTGGLDPAALDTTSCGPMVDRVESMGVFGGFTTVVTLDPRTQNFLDHHRIDGTPVLPGVMGVEAFAEAARLFRPHLHVVEVSDVEFLTPFKFYRDEARDVQVCAHFRRAGDDVIAECALVGTRVLASAAEPQTTTHFTGSVRLSEAAPPRPDGEKPPAVENGALGSEAVYEVYFHGPAYQVVAEAWKWAEGAAGTYADDLPENHVPAGAPLTMSPRLIELCFQVAGVWEIGRNAAMGLPRRIRSVSSFADPATATGRLCALVQPDGSGAFDCRVVDDTGAVFVTLGGYETIDLPDALDGDQAAEFKEVMS